MKYNVENPLSLSLCWGNVSLFLWGRPSRSEWWWVALEHGSQTVCARVWKQHHHYPLKKGKCSESKLNNTEMRQNRLFMMPSPSFDVTGCNIPVTMIENFTLEAEEWKPLCLEAVEKLLHSARIGLQLGTNHTEAFCLPCSYSCTIVAQYSPPFFHLYV